MRDLCIEAGIIAEGSVAAVMERCHYKRAVRAHKYVYEALLQLAMKVFPAWIDEHHISGRDDYDRAMLLLETFKDDICKEGMEDLMEDVSFINTVDLLSSYLAFLREDNGPLSSFWMSYIDMVGNMLLGMIWASREGNWHLHLSAIRDMIPWAIA